MKLRLDEDQAEWAKEYRAEVEAELRRICYTIPDLLDQNLIAEASTRASTLASSRARPWTSPSTAMMWISLSRACAPPLQHQIGHCRT